MCLAQRGKHYTCILYFRCASGSGPLQHLAGCLQPKQTQVLTHRIPCQHGSQWHCSKQGLSIETSLSFWLSLPLFAPAALVFLLSHSICLCLHFSLTFPPPSPSVSVPFINTCSCMLCACTHLCVFELSCSGRVNNLSVK